MDGIETALTRLVAAYAAAGGTTDEFDPVDDATLEDLRESVTPLRVPTDIEHVWRTFQEFGVPGIIDTNSLGTVDQARRAMPLSNQSRALLVIGSGRATCYIELDDAHGAGGGAVWTLEEFGAEVREVAPSLTALLDATAIAWEQGIVMLSEEHPFPWAAWDDDGWEHLKAELLPPGRVAGSRPSGWLPRWLAPEGVTPADIAARGPTTRVGELLNRMPWTGTETVRGRVRSMVAMVKSSGTVIDDGTGEMLIYVQRDADPFGLLTIGSEAELDVRSFPAGMEVDPGFDPNAFDALAVAVREV